MTSQMLSRHWYISRSDSNVFTGLTQVGPEVLQNREVRPPVATSSRRTPLQMGQSSSRGLKMWFTHWLTKTTPS